MSLENNLEKVALGAEQYAARGDPEAKPPELIKSKILRYGGSLVMEKNSDGEWVMSTGRVSWWLAFLPALYVFLAAFVATGAADAAVSTLSRDITPNHLTVILTLAGYNFGKKAVDAAKKIWGKNDGPG